MGIFPRRDLSAWKYLYVEIFRVGIFCVDVVGEDSVGIFRVGTLQGTCVCIPAEISPNAVILLLYKKKHHT